MRYRKRIKIAPGVYANLSNRGVSTSFGVKGFRICTGRNGTYLNTSIPGTGLYNRRKIGGKPKSGSFSPRYQNSPNTSPTNSNQKTTGTCLGLFIAVIVLTIITGELFTGYLADHTIDRFFVSLGIVIAGFGVFALIENIWVKTYKAPKLRKDLEQVLIDEESETLKLVESDIEKVQAKMDSETRNDFIFAYNCFINTRKRLVLESLYAQRKIDFENRPDFKKAIIQKYYEENNSKLEKLDESFPLISFDLQDEYPDSIISAFRSVSLAFDKLSNSDKIWVVTSSVDSEDKKSNTSYVNRDEVKIYPSSFLNLLVGDLAIPHFINEKNESIYIYPGFIIKDKGGADFDILPLKLAHSVCESQNFIVDDNPPKDAKFLRSSWQYVNKNGQPDRRYSYNPKINIHQYANLSLPSFNIKLQISNYDASLEFSEVLNKLINSTPSTIDEVKKEAEFIKNENAMNSNPFLGISESYFNLCKSQTESILSYLKTLQRDDAFVEFVNNVRGMSWADNAQYSSYNSRLVIFLLYDLMKCYTNLGHSLDPKSKEILCPALLVTALVNKETNITYNVLDEFYSITVSTMIGVLEIAKNLQDPEMTGITDFYIPRLFNVYNKDRVSEYRVLLYRFSSLVAKADGVIEPTEADYLANLMKDSPNVNEEVVIPVPPPSYSNISPLSLDPLTLEIARYVVLSGVASTSNIQRKYTIGYNRAGRIMDHLESLEIVGPSNGGKPRTVLLTPTQLDYRINQINSSNSLTSNDHNALDNQPKKIDKKPKKSNSSEKLNKLIGLESVKQEVSKLTNLIKIQKQREEKGLKNSPISYHCVFTGNPGTGKTTVARIIASLYQELGILSKGHFVETDRSGLVAEYVGQTAVKTNKIIDSALGGVLFIDEAYSLVQGGNNDFGLEAISTLLKRMEDDRDKLVVILAGYGNEMQEFINANPGLQSRFNRYIHFEDYSASELLSIFEFNLKNHEYVISDSAKDKLMKYLENAILHKDKNFGNGRFVRNLFEKSLELQATRLSQIGDLTKEDLQLINEDDIPQI